MKFTCNKTQLLNAVTNVSRVVSTKSTTPALEGIQLKAYGSVLTLTGYDKEAGITTFINAEIKEDGEIVLTAKLFQEMIRKMEDEKITVIVGDKNLTEVKSGLAKFNILGIPSDDFPELPNITEGQGINIIQPVLKSMIDQTLFAVSITDSKPVHTGSLFDIENGYLSIVSVDGFRLAMRKEPININKKISFVVPGKALSEISKLLSEDNAKNTELMVSKSHIIFKIDNYTVISRLLEGDFIDYKNSIPESNTSILKINSKNFTDSLELVSLLISDKVRSPLRINLSDNEIDISCSSSLGKSSDHLTCEYDGETCEIGFNSKFLLDAIKASDSDIIKLELNGPLKPVKIVPLQGDNYLFLVLPVRLKNE